MRLHQSDDLNAKFQALNADLQRYYVASKRLRRSEQPVATQKPVEQRGFFASLLGTSRVSASQPATTSLPPSQPLIVADPVKSYLTEKLKKIGAIITVKIEKSEEVAFQGFLIKLGYNGQFLLESFVYTTERTDMIEFSDLNYQESLGFIKLLCCCSSANVSDTDLFKVVYKLIVSGEGDAAATELGMARREIQVAHQAIARQTMNVAEVVQRKANQQTLVSALLALAGNLEINFADRECAELVVGILSDVKKSDRTSPVPIPARLLQTPIFDTSLWQGARVVGGGDVTLTLGRISKLCDAGISSISNVVITAAEPGSLRISDLLKLQSCTISGDPVVDFQSKTQAPVKLSVFIATYNKLPRPQELKLPTISSEGFLSLDPADRSKVVTVFLQGQQEAEVERKAAAELELQKAAQAQAVRQGAASSSPAQQRPRSATTIASQPAFEAYDHQKTLVQAINLWISAKQEKSQTVIPIETMRSIYDMLSEFLSNPNRSKELLGRDENEFVLKRKLSSLSAMQDVAGMTLFKFVDRYDNPFDKRKLDLNDLKDLNSEINRKEREVAETANRAAEEKRIADAKQKAIDPKRAAEVRGQTVAQRQTSAQSTGNKAPPPLTSKALSSAAVAAAAAATSSVPPKPLLVEDDTETHAGGESLANSSFALSLGTEFRALEGGGKGAAGIFNRISFGKIGELEFVENFQQLRQGLSELQEGVDAKQFSYLSAMSQSEREALINRINRSQSLPKLAEAREILQHITHIGVLRKANIEDASRHSKALKAALTKSIRLCDLEIKEQEEAAQQYLKQTKVYNPFRQAQNELYPHSNIPDVLSPLTPNDFYNAIALLRVKNACVLQDVGALKDAISVLLRFRLGVFVIKTPDSDHFAVLSISIDKEQKVSCTYFDAFETADKEESIKDAIKDAIKSSDLAVRIDEKNITYNFAKPAQISSVTLPGSEGDDDQVHSRKEYYVKDASDAANLAFQWLLGEVNGTFEYDSLRARMVANCSANSTDTSELKKFINAFFAGRTTKEIDEARNKLLLIPPVKIADAAASPGVTTAATTSTAVPQFSLNFSVALPVVISAVETTPIKTDQAKLSDLVTDIIPAPSAATAQTAPAVTTAEKLTAFEKQVDFVAALVEINPSVLDAQLLLQREVNAPHEIFRTTKLAQYTVSELIDLSNVLDQLRKNIPSIKTDEPGAVANIELLNKQLRKIQAMQQAVAYAMAYHLGKVYGEGRSPVAASAAPAATRLVGSLQQRPGSQETISSTPSSDSDADSANLKSKVSSGSTVTRFEYFTEYAHKHLANRKEVVKNLPLPRISLTPKVKKFLPAERKAAWWGGDWKADNKFINFFIFNYSQDNYRLDVQSEFERKMNSLNKYANKINSNVYRVINFSNIRTEIEEAKTFLDDSDVLGFSDKRRETKQMIKDCRDILSAFESQLKARVSLPAVVESFKTNTEASVAAGNAAIAKPKLEAIIDALSSNNLTDGMLRDFNQNYKAKLVGLEQPQKDRFKGMLEIFVSDASPSAVKKAVAGELKRVLVSAEAVITSNLIQETVKRYLSENWSNLANLEKLLQGDKAFLQQFKAEGIDAKTFDVVVGDRIAEINNAVLQLKQEIDSRTTSEGLSKLRDEIGENGAKLLGNRFDDSGKTLRGFLEEKTDRLTNEERLAAEAARKAQVDAAAAVKEAQEQPAQVKTLDEQFVTLCELFKNHVSPAPAGAAAAASAGESQDFKSVFDHFIAALEKAKESGVEQFVLSAKQKARAEEILSPITAPSPLKDLFADVVRKSGSSLEGLVVDLRKGFEELTQQQSRQVVPALPQRGSGDSIATAAAAGYDPNSSSRMFYRAPTPPAEAMKGLNELFDLVTNYKISKQASEREAAKADGAKQLCQKLLAVKTQLSNPTGELNTKIRELLTFVRENLTGKQLEKNREKGGWFRADVAGLNTLEKYFLRAQEVAIAMSPESVKSDSQLPAQSATYIHNTMGRR